MTHGFMSILIQGMIRVFICMDEFEIGLLLLRLFIVRDVRFFVLLKFLFLSWTNLFNQVHTKVSVRVRVLSGYFCYCSLSGLLFEPGFFLLDYSQILVQDFVLKG